jgi:hypothetical protein
LISVGMKSPWSDTHASVQYISVSFDRHSESTSQEDAWGMFDRHVSHTDVTEMSCRAFPMLVGLVIETETNDYPF